MSGRHFIVIPVLLLAFGLRVHLFADLGSQADEGVYITAARQLLEGDLLYRDLFWNHTPGLAVLLAFTFRLTGIHILIGRLLSLGAAMITISALALAGRWLYAVPGSAGRNQKVAFGAGILAALLLALAPLPIFWSRFAMLENFETAFAVLSMALAIRAAQTRAPRVWLLAGVMAGLALLFKISALVLVASVGLFLVIWWLARPGGDKIRAGLLFLGGMALALLPVAAVILIWGIGPDFIHFISGPERLALLAGWPEKITAFLDWAIRRPYLPLSILGLLLAARLRKPVLWLIALWATMEMLFLFLPPILEIDYEGFSHYVLPAVAALCLTAGAGLAWGRQQLNTRQGLILATFGVVCLSAILTLPGLIRDLNHVTRETRYPSSGFAQEEAVGQALSLVTPADSPILVFGNSAFYFLADRPPASRFYYYPAYLPTSRLVAESDAALVSALQNPDTAAVLLTGEKGDELTEPVQGALADYWAPVATLPYDYQKAATLYLPRPIIAEPAREVTRFNAGGAEIILHKLEPHQLAPSTFLVELDWSAMAPVNETYTVFVHLVGPEGSLVTQHDSMPVLDTRPTTSWKPGELINDRHWLELPPGAPAGEYKLLVGLYQLTSGERLSILGTEETSVTVPVQLPGEH